MDTFSYPLIVLTGAVTVEETISRVVVAVLSADWKAASVPVVICGIFIESVNFVTQSALRPSHFCLVLILFH